MTLRPTSTVPHRLHRWLTRTPADVLNMGAAPADDRGLFERLKTLQTTLSSAAFDSATGRVDYAGLRGSAAYAAYRALIPALSRFDLHQLVTPAHKLAFWINLYNLLAVDAVLHYGVERDINEVQGVFYRAGYRVDGLFFSLHDIEQGILRANRGHPAVLGPQFGTDDPRRQHALNQPEPRIHFALVCAAESCPAIRLYDAESIAAQLDLATRHFVNSSAVEIDLPAKTVCLSKIFQWYAPDFGASFAVTLGFGSAIPLLRWIAPYLQDEAERVALTLHAHDYRVTFADYDWSLNRLA